MANSRKKTGEAKKPKPGAASSSIPKTAATKTTPPAKTTAPKPAARTTAQTAKQSPPKAPAKSKSALAKDIGASIDASSADSTTTRNQVSTANIAPETVTPEPAPSEKNRSVFAPLFLGGILAAILGFLAARSDILDPILPDAFKGPDIEAALADLRQSDSQLADSLASAKAEIAAFEQADLAPLETQISAIQSDIAALAANSETQETHLRDLEARLPLLDARLTEVEKRPMTDGASEAAIAAYDRELEKLRAAIAVQTADVENLVTEARATEQAARALEKNATIAARHAELQGAMTRLLKAVDDGASYESELAAVADAGIAVPDALTATATDGIASLGALGGAFPKAARAALSAARTDAGESGGVAGFFQRQLGARSVEPKDGAGADAVLSRAEAALRDGRLAEALEEVSALPDVAQTEMSDWADAATTRLKALQAADELAQSLK